MLRDQKSRHFQIDSIHASPHLFESGGHDVGHGAVERFVPLRGVPGKEGILSVLARLRTEDCSHRVWGLELGVQGLGLRGQGLWVGVEDDPKIIQPGTFPTPSGTPQTLNRPFNPAHFPHRLKHPKP